MRPLGKDRCQAVVSLSREQTREVTAQRRLHHRIGGERRIRVRSACELNENKLHLERHWILGPQGAVVVEDGDAVLSGNEVRRTGRRDALVRDRLLVGRVFQAGSGSEPAWPESDAQPVVPITSARKHSTRARIAVSGFAIRVNAHTDSVDSVTTETGGGYDQLLGRNASVL
jgi:hypothetical protein